MSLLQEIRTACQAVAGQARHVHVDESRVSFYASSLPLDEASCPALDPETHYLGYGEDTAAFLVTLDTINFGSGYFPHLIKRPGMSGYFTIAAGLNDHFSYAGPLSAQRLTRITPAECAAIMGQDRADPVAGALMERFSMALKDLGHFLLERYSGRFVGPIEAAGGSAERLVQLLSAMPYFNDVEIYDGREVPFYKRAQLLAADLALAFGGKSWGRFEDLDRLTIFADNLVPHVLRLDGLLVYDESLAAHIDREELILAGSPEEVEIRACAVHAVELLAAALRAAGHPVTSRELDYLLWNRGQKPEYKVHPRHRTRTVYY